MARDMEAQVRQAYANINKVLAQYGATMDNIVDNCNMPTYNLHHSSVAAVF